MRVCVCVCVHDYYADLLTLMLDVDMMFFALVQATRSRVCIGMDIICVCVLHSDYSSMRW